MLTSLPACPCGLAQPYASCCGQYHDNKAIAQTPEALMRSRYSAFTLAKMDYLLATMKPPSSDLFEVTSARQWALANTWLELEILKVSPIQKNLGTVEFKAHYQVNNAPEYLHEISTFRCDEGRWYYIDGVGPRMRAQLTEPKSPRR